MFKVCHPLGIHERDLKVGYTKREIRESVSSALGYCVALTSSHILTHYKDFFFQKIRVHYCSG